MNLKKEYINILRNYEFEKIYGNRKNFDTYSFFNNTLKEKIFTVMLSNGGKATEHGVLYDGFEFRMIDDKSLTREYLDSTVIPMAKSLGISDYYSLSQKPYNMIKSLNIFDNYIKEYARNITFDVHEKDDYEMEMWGR